MFPSGEASLFRNQGRRESIGGKEDNRVTA